MESQLNLELIVKCEDGNEDDIFVFVRNRNNIREAFKFWKEKDKTTNDSQTRQTRSSSTSEIQKTFEEKEKNQESNGHAVLKSISYNSLKVIRPHDSGKLAISKNENASSRRTTINNGSKLKASKSKKPKVVDKTFDDIVVKSKKKSAPISDVTETTLEREPITPPRSVELKRKAFAFKKQVAISPHSQENPIQELRGRFLERKLKQENDTVNECKVDIFIEEIDVTSPRLDLSSEPSSPKKSKKSPKPLSISEPPSPEASDAEDLSPKIIHKRKKISRRSSTGNEITHLGRSSSTQIKDKIGKIKWSSDLLTVKPKYSHRLSPKVVRNKETKDGVVKKLESFFMTRDEQLKRSSNLNIFNIPLDMCVPINKEAPDFVVQVCNNIREKSKSERLDDIFELNSMTGKDLLVIRKSIEDQSMDISNEKDIKIVANSLLLFFIDLNESLCTSKLYDSFLFLADIKDNAYRFRLTHTLIHALQSPYRSTLKYMANFIADLSNGNEENLILLCNFFAPSMIRSKFELAFEPSSPNSEKQKSSHTLKPSLELFQNTYIKVLEKSEKNNKAASTLKYIVTTRKKLFKLSFQKIKFVLLRGKLFLEAANFPEMVNLLLDEFYNDVEYVDIFFLNFPQFSTSVDMLKMFLNIYDNNKPDMEYCKRRRVKILMTLKIWFKSYKRELSKDKEFISIVSDYTSINHTIKEEEILWNDLYATFKKSSGFGLKDIDFHPSKLAEIIFKTRITDFNPELVAKAITMIDLDNFKSIDKRECLNKSFCDPVKGPNFFNMASQFNRLNLWVQTLIIDTLNTKDRVNLINFFASVMESLLQYNNFNSSLAIYSALTSTAMSRLSKTWSRIGKKVTKNIESAGILFSFDRNYRNYHIKLKESTLPAIPQIVLISRNLFAIEENMESVVDNLINFEKMRSTYSIIKDIIKFQKSVYSFERNDVLISQLKKLSHKTEEEILDISLNLEKKN